MQFDQCYDNSFTHSGTTYVVHVYYTENTALQGGLEHALANNDDANGDNIQAVAMADEAETATRFYDDRNKAFLGTGNTELNVYVAEDPRTGGVIYPNSIYVDDDAIDNNDVLAKRLLAFHEVQHLVQDKYDNGGVGWQTFYGEGIARAIEDRADTALDADTGHFFIPEVDGILSNNGNRTSDISTISYRSVLWWTWLLDQYRQMSDVNPVIGWQALLDFYTELNTEANQLKALRDYISSEGSTFAKDFIDYTLALYAFSYSPSDARLGFLDTEINVRPGLSNHTVVTGGPALGTVSPAMSPRSSRYWEFNPANQCDFIGFTFDGNGKKYGFSVMTVDGGTLQDRWTSHSDGWARTVRSSGLDSVVGVVTAIDESGTVDVERGCVTPTLNIESPTTSAFAMVGLATQPRNFIARLDVSGPDGSGVAGLLASDFQVQLRRAGGGPLINANIVNSTFVQDAYWLLVQAPSDTDGAVNGAFYDLIVTLGASSDTEVSSVLYVERTQDVVIVLDRSGSMGGGTGKIEAARNAANLLVNELADDDQGAFISFSDNATLREQLARIGDGTNRADLQSAIASETEGGGTSIGDGMDAAAGEEDARGLAANACSFVLLSDGHENTAEFWADVQADVVDNGCPIHAVALGAGTDEARLQQIAGSVSGGSYDYATTSGGVPLSSGVAESHGAVAGLATSTLGWENNLSKVYDSKATQIAGRQRILSHVGRPQNIISGTTASSCVDFEDLLLRTEYNVGNSFVDSGATITGETFFWGDGTPFNGGFTRVENGGAAGGTGNELQVNNINLAFDFGGPVPGLELPFGEFGGNLNIQVNGDFRNFGNFDDIDGLTIGGVLVSVTAPSQTSPRGRLKLSGTVQSFAIGGQELWIDDVCQQTKEGPTFFVDDASDELVVAIAWQFPVALEFPHEVQLIDPNGFPVAEVPHRRLSSQLTNEVWTVPDPKPGVWTVKVSGLFQEYLVTASVRSLYELYLFIGTPVEDRSQGVQVPILASFVGRGDPLMGADVNAVVTAPDGARRALHLFDDGNHGDSEAGDGVYGNVYTATSLADETSPLPAEGEEPQVVGSYLVDVVGVWEGGNTAGAAPTLRREAQGSFAIEASADRDNDGIPDLWEEDHGQNPDSPGDVADDGDGDGLTNLCEFQVGTDPRNSDTDGGGESDGSEVEPQPIQELCVVEAQDPLDPDDDRVGPLGSMHVFPEATLPGDPFVRVVLGGPDRGDLLSWDVYRRIFNKEGELLQDWELIALGVGGLEYVDGDVNAGLVYEYRAVPTVESEADGPILSRIVEAGPVQASSDPYAPAGSVLINGGEPTTENLIVALQISADDSTRGRDGSPDEPVPGTPVDDLMMRLSNGPDLTGLPWEPFRPEVPVWNLGALAPGEVAIVYVQFMDQAGNIGDGLPDSIEYDPSGITPTQTATPTPTPTTTPTLTTTPTPTREKLLGDVNGNGSIDSIDAALVLQFVADFIDSVSNADVNEDSEIDSIDAALILQFGAALITRLPP